MTYVMAIDQGTTSSRAILFDEGLAIAAVAQKEFPQHYPASGWVEHDPEDLWSTVVETAKEAMDKVGATASDIAAIGITNQRETTVVWDKTTGKALHNAIVWQDRRTADFCASMKDEHEALVTDVTGFCSIPISRRPNSNGSSTRSRGRVRGPRMARSCSEQSTAI